MRVICSRSFSSLPILILIGIGIGTLTAIQSARAAAPADAPTPPTTYPEIVRLTYVEGDVRVSRGKPGEKADEGESGATGWEQATAGLPLQSGYSLVTGKGRAEIELEDASTVYLGDNSVLTFDELTATAGVPYTEISLLSGVATMNVHATLPGEFFRMNTPTDHISLPYPHGAIWRVNSYLDAVSVTPLQDLTVIQPGTAAPAPETPGKTVSYSHGHVVAVPVQPDASASSAWDQWVAARILARDSAMSAAMKQAGLTAPLPGLDQMNGKGSFFACAPYGTCWVPTNGWDGKSAGDADAAPKSAAISGAMPSAIRGRVQPARLLTVSQVVEQADPPASDESQPAASASSPSKKSARLPGQSAEDAFLAAHPGATFYADDYTFPCSSDSVSDLIGVDPITGRETVVDSELDTFALDAFFLRFPHRGFYPFLGYDAYWGYNSWDWTVCHTGAWIRWRHRYVWVAGNKRHHRPPVRWVKSGRTVGFVPIHPRDVAGKPPLNLKSGLFHVTGKDGRPIERVSFKDSDSLKLLTEPPKEFREPPLEPLKIAEAPRPEAHSAWSSTIASRGAAEHAPAGAHGTVEPAGKTLLAREQGVPITFDRKTQSFSVARQISGEGGRPMTVSTPLGGGRVPNSGGFSGARGSGGYGGSSGGSAQGRAGSNGGGGGSSASRSGGGGGSSGASASRGGGGGGGFSGGGGGGGASHAGGGGGGGGGGGASSHK